MIKRAFATALASLLFVTPLAGANDIVHDAEQQRLEDQHGTKWSAEDKEIDAKLEQLHKKFGKRPNIIHIMWDDMKYGAIGHPMLNQVTGYKSPNINKLAAGGDVYAHVLRTLVHTDPCGGRYGTIAGAQWHDLPHIPDSPHGLAGV